ncbi:MAG TPA: DUF1684 domain-containing protein [Gaiellaceae bacterium]|nr:DUF1684 domain-containing protein [Gaiellaceae bacterium]
MDELTLLDWKRRVFALYAEVRAAPEPEDAWRRWRAARDDLFASHPQSPLPPGARRSFAGLDYFDYDPALRVLGEVEPAPHERLEIATSGDRPYAFTRFARVRFDLGGEPQRLDLHWLDGYGGGLFLSFADATSGSETYGAGRYLLDTVKGADLGEADGRLVLDFNFAYNPSCSYDPRWVCPLAPPGNRLAVAVRGGERHHPR